MESEATLEIEFWISDRGNCRGTDWRNCLRCSSTEQRDKTRSRNCHRHLETPICCPSNRPVWTVWMWRRGGEMRWRKPSPLRRASGVRAFYSAAATDSQSASAFLPKRTGFDGAKCDGKPRRNLQKWPEEDRCRTVSNGPLENKSTPSRARTTLQCRPLIKELLIVINYTLNIKHFWLFIVVSTGMLLSSPVVVLSWNVKIHGQFKTTAANQMRAQIRRQDLALIRLLRGDVME